MQVGSHRSLKDVRMTIEVYNNLEKLATEKYHNIDNFKNACKTQNHSGFKASDVTANNTEFDKENLFYDKYVAITGTLEKMLRKEAMQLITDLGGHCQDGVNKETNYLILGNNDYNPILRGKKSSKLLKAENLKMKIEFDRRLANLWKIYTKLEKHDKMFTEWRKSDG